MYILRLVTLDGSSPGYLALKEFSSSGGHSYDHTKSSRFYGLYGLPGMPPSFYSTQVMAHLSTNIPLGRPEKNLTSFFGSVLCCNRLYYSTINTQKMIWRRWGGGGRYSQPKKIEWVER